MTTEEQSDIRRKLKVLNHAKELGNISKTCRYFGVSRETYYQWKRAYEAKGESALINSKPCPQNPKIRVAADIEENILYLRKHYHLGQQRTSWYLLRYHNMKVSPGGVYGVLKRHGLNKQPQNQRKRSMEHLNAMRRKCPATASRSM